MNLSDWAAQVGVSKFTAYRWFREGSLPVPAQRVGRLIVVDVAPTSGSGRTVVYARVSSHDQRGDLDRQVARLSAWATSQGLSVSEVVTEVGSGMNSKRRKLARLLADPSATTIVVEHRDRGTRFGCTSSEQVLAMQGRRLEVVFPKDSDDDLVHDFMSVIISMAARIDGRRKAEQIKQCVEQVMKQEV